MTRLTSSEREAAWIYDLRLLNRRIRGLQRVPSVRTRAIPCADCRGWNYKSPSGDRVILELKHCLREFHKVLDTDPPAPILIKAAAKLWIKLMTIRPFLDGNRRTVRALLARCFTQQGLTIKSFQALSKFPTTGHFHEDIVTCQLALGRCLTSTQHTSH